MAKRFEPGIVTTAKVDKILPGQFIAKFDGVCNICGHAIFKGEILHFVNDRAAHVNCHSNSDHSVESDDYGAGRRRDGFNRFSGDGGEPEKFETGAPRRGKRKNSVCGDCFMEHAGECP